MASGEIDEARGLLEPLAAGGRSGPGYAEALELLVPLLGGEDDALARSTVLAARAEMAQGSERAQLLHEAARAAQQAGDEARAARLARASVATEASQDALLLLAGLMRDASELGEGGGLAHPGRAARLSGGPPGTPARGRGGLGRGRRSGRGPGAARARGPAAPRDARARRVGRALPPSRRPRAGHRARVRAAVRAGCVRPVAGGRRGARGSPAHSPEPVGTGAGIGERRATASPRQPAPGGRHRERARGVRPARRVPPGDGPRRGSPSRGAPLTARRRLGRGAAACAPASAVAGRAGGNAARRAGERGRGHLAGAGGGVAAAAPGSPRGRARAWAPAPRGAGAGAGRRALAGALRAGPRRQPTRGRGLRARRLGGGHPRPGPAVRATNPGR